MARHMAITREKKAQIIEKLEGIMKDAASVVFINFHELSADDANEIRGTLKEKSVGYFVAKKTLVRKVLGESEISGEVPEFPGELALVWGEEDPVVPAGSIYAFQKDLDGAVRIVGGVFEDSFKDEAAMTEIAQIPPKDVLQGMFVNLINSPIQRLVIAMGQIAEKKS